VLLSFVEAESMQTLKGGEVLAETIPNTPLLIYSQCDGGT